MLRQRGGGADFLPLDDSAAGSGPAAAAVAADDDDDDDDDIEIDDGFDDDSKRVGMRGLPTPRNVRRKAEVSAALKQAQGQHDDEEVRLWETERVQRSAGHGGLPMQRSHLDTMDTGNTVSLARQASAQLAPLPKVSVDQVCETLRAALRQHQSDDGKNSKMTKSERELVTVGEALHLTESDIKNLQSKLTTLEPKYVFFQELWEYVQNLIACLDSKVASRRAAAFRCIFPLSCAVRTPDGIIGQSETVLVGCARQLSAARRRPPQAGDIEECEVQLLEAQKARAEAHFNRLWLDMDDMAAEVAGGPPGGGGGGTMAAAAAAMEHDEFGRDQSWSIEAGAEKRAARRAAARSSAVGGGLATAAAAADESGSDAERYSGDRSDTLKAAGLIFADTGPEFAEVMSVKAKMAEWKRRHPHSYHDTYVSLNLVKLFAPYARLELLQWEPAAAGAAAATGLLDSIQGMHWFAELADGVGEDDGADDADTEIVPKLVRAHSLHKAWLALHLPCTSGLWCMDASGALIASSRALKVEAMVLPRVSEWLSTTWDPLSAESTTAALAYIADLLVFVTPQKKPMQDLIAAGDTNTPARPRTALWPCQ